MLWKMRFFLNQCRQPEIYLKTWRFGTVSPNSLITNIITPRLDEEFSRAKRYNLELSCIFFDIDDFKRINDHYGHLTGDVVLRQIGRLVTQNLRKSDIASRYGGEEFVICLANTDSDSAFEFAERLLAAIRSLSIQQLKGERITASIGISTYRNNNVTSYQELLQAADNAMYQAKKSGKDQICRAPLEDQGRKLQNLGSAIEGKHENQVVAHSLTLKSENS